MERGIFDSHTISLQAFSNCCLKDVQIYQTKFSHLKPLNDTIKFLLPGNYLMKEIRIS